MEPGSSNHQHIHREPRLERQDTHPVCYIRWKRDNGQRKRIKKNIPRFGMAGRQAAERSKPECHPELDRLGLSRIGYVPSMPFQVARIPPPKDEWGIHNKKIIDYASHKSRETPGFFRTLCFKLQPASRTNCKKRYGANETGLENAIKI